MNFTAIDIRCVPAYLLISLLCLFSCQKKKDAYQERVQAQQEAMKSGVVIDTIFLDFRFGMTPGEYKAHCKKLEQEGKIKKAGNNDAGNPIYSYTINLAHSKYDCLVAPEFYEGKMNNLSLKVEPGIYSGSMCVLELSSLYFQKYDYRIQAVHEEHPKYSNCDMMDFYKGNLQISLNCLWDGKVAVQYIDNRVKIAKDAKRDSLKQQEVNKTANDM